MWGGWCQFNLHCPRNRTQEGVEKDFSLFLQELFFFSYSIYWLFFIHLSKACPRSPSAQRNSSSFHCKSKKKKAPSVSFWGELKIQTGSLMSKLTLFGMMSPFENLMEATDSLPRRTQLYIMRMGGPSLLHSKAFLANLWEMIREHSTGHCGLGRRTLADTSCLGPWLLICWCRPQPAVL